MPITLNGDTGITTPGLTNTGSTTLVSLTTTGNTILGDQSTDTLNVANGNLVLNSSGNAGLGVTPAAWLTYTTLQIKDSALSAINNNQVVLSQNGLYTTGSAWQYINTNFATLYQQNAGNHNWQTAPSGTAGTALTFTTAMTLTAAGNLGLGTTTPTGAAGRAFVINGGAGQTRIALKNSTTGDAADDGFQILLDAGGVDVTLEQRENGVMRFATNSAERARIDSSGNFLVGGTSVLQSAKITSYGSVSAQNGGVDGTFANAFVGVYSGNSNEHNAIQTAVSSAGTGSGFRFRASLGGGSATTYPVLDLTRDQTIFYAANNERARITSSGDVGIGRTDPPMRLSAAAAGSVISGTATIGSNMQGIQVYNTNSAVTNNAVGIWFPTGPHQAGIASFRPNAEAGWATALAFYTHGAATSNLNDCYERMRIDGEGNVLINTTTRTAAGIANGGTLQVSKEFMSVGSLAGVFWENRSGGVTVSSNWYGWYNTGGTNFIFNGASNIASINGSTGAYTALSDRNKKKDFEESTIGLSAVMQLKPTLFRMLDEAEDAPKQLGFIAQDVKDVIPQAYVEQSVVDAGNNNSTYIGLNDRPIIAALTKAIQELKSELDSVKTELAALKGN